MVLTLLLFSLQASAQTSEITIHNITVSPSEIVVGDKDAWVTAIISSTGSLERVALWHGELPPEASIQNVNYTASYLYEDHVNGSNQYWMGQLPIPSKPSRLVFYVNATDASGQSVVYPSAQYPEGFLVLQPPNAALAAPILTLNGFALGAQYSYANLSMQLRAIIPSLNGYPVYLDMYSIPHNYSILFSGSLYQDPQNRFSYSLKTSFITELNGSTSNYPYDSYLFGFTAKINYPRLNFTNTPIYLGFSNQIANTIQDSWTYPREVMPVVSYRGNQTILSVEFQLTRSHQSTSLPIIAIANVILIASIFIFEPKDIEKRLTVFLTAIVMSLSVLISPNLNPFGFGNTIFESFFSYLMFASAFLIMSSTLASLERSNERFTKTVDIIFPSFVMIYGLWIFSSTVLPVSIWLLLSIVPLFAIVTNTLRGRTLRWRWEKKSTK